MNQVQLRFQAGTENCMWVEKIADNLLAFPKAMWGEKTISHINGEFKLKDYYSFNSFLCDRNSCFSTIYDFGIIKITLLTAYLIGSVIATPLLAVGLIFKEIALQNNNSSNQYHSKICKAVPIIVEAKKIEEKIIILSQAIIDCDATCKKFREGTPEYNKAVELADLYLIQMSALKIRKAEIEKTLSTIN